MRELSFLVDSVMSLVVGAFLLRLLFQLLRADFRNPLARAVLKLTDPLVLPLRRVLPPIGRVDTASLVAVVIVQLIRTLLDQLIEFGRLAAVGPLLIVAIVQVLDMALMLFLIALILYVIMSWVAPDNYNPASRLLATFVEPLLRPFRRALPPIGGLDLSAFAASVLIYLLHLILIGRILPALLSLR